jgi:hypothetical protein
MPSSIIGDALEKLRSLVSQLIKMTVMLAKFIKNVITKSFYQTDVFHPVSSQQSLQLVHYRQPLEGGLSSPSQSWNHEAGKLLHEC